MVLSGLGIAQTTGNPNGQESQRKITFRVMAMRDIVKDVGFVNEGEIESFSASRSRPTPWMTYKGLGPLSFYRSDELKAYDETQPYPTPVAQFSPEGSGSWLLLFLKSDETNTIPEYRVVPIPDDDSTVEEGIRLLNLTNTPLAVAINDETVRVDPGNQEHMNPAPLANSTMSMKIAAQENEEWRMVSSTAFGHRPEARITYYIFDTGRRIQFKRFAESVKSLETQRE